MSITAARGASVPVGRQTSAAPLPVVGRMGPRQRLFMPLRRGVTVRAAAAEAGVSAALAEVMVDEMRRTGLLDSADTLCASGLGACGGGTSDEVRIHCAGCPMVPLAPRR